MTGLEPTTSSAPPFPLGVAAVSQTPHVFCIEWNAENQLTRVTKNSVEQARFKYDAKGRRAEKVGGAITTSWAYDSDDILREVRGATTVKYVHGPDIDEPLAADDGSSLSYLHADALGSNARTTSAAGTVTLSRRYDAWGNLEAGGSNGFAFTGREHDSETGLAYYRARYYDPKVGRFATEDPIGFGGGLNFYRYVENNPTNQLDPFGLAPGDKRCGLPPEFWRWYHRQYKDPGKGVPNIDCGAARKLYEWWKTIGSPGPGTLRCIPFIIVSPCLIVPAFCECDEDGCFFVGPQGAPPGA